MILGSRQRLVELRVVRRRQSDVESDLDCLPEIARHHGDARDVKLAVSLFVVGMVKKADQGDGKRNDHRYRDAEPNPERYIRPRQLQAEHSSTCGMERRIMRVLADGIELAGIPV